MVYVVGRNYFFVNNGSVPADSEVTDRKQADKLFGTAVFMGKGGEPLLADVKK